MQITSNSDTERFWHRVRIIVDDDSCWLWAGARHARQRPHRQAWQLTRGPIPAGLLVLHKCDTPVCCRPSHLWLATPAECMANAARQGRMASGSRNPAAKLTHDQVLAIRQLYRSSPTGSAPPEPPARRWTQAALAERFGVAQSTIHYLLAGRHWREPTQTTRTRT